MQKYFVTLFACCLFHGASAQMINENIENTTPDDRYVENGDGTVTDLYTGLMWKRCSEGQTWSEDGCNGEADRKMWDEALTLAENSEFAGYSDWRIPNVVEIKSLIANDRTRPAVNNSVFPSIPENGWYEVQSYWTSTPKLSTNGDIPAKLVDLYEGHDPLIIHTPNGVYSFSYRFVRSVD